MRTAYHFDKPAPRIVVDIKSQHVIQHSFSTRKKMKGLFEVVTMWKSVKRKP